MVAYYYELEWSKSAEDGLRELGETLAKKVRHKVKETLSKNVESPYPLSNKNIKALKGTLKGFRYRCYGKYRIVYEMFKEKLLIRVLEVDNRSDIYPISKRKYGN